MDTDLITQIFQYLLGIIPGDIAGNIVAVVTTIVTICTLIVRFWKEPEATSKAYKLWKFIHTLASFKKPAVTKTVTKEVSNGDKTA